MHICWLPIQWRIPLSLEAGYGKHTPSQKSKFLFGKSMYDSIGVKNCLARRGMLVNTSYPLCQTEVETITHALRDCNMARAIWYQLGIRVSNTSFFTQNLRDWLTTNGKSVQNHSLTSPPWNVLFLFAPEVGWMKLNTDGASNAFLGLAGGGGLIRDEAGRWVVGFTRKLGKVNSFLAELWAFRDGLLLCQQMNMITLIVELDAKVLVKALTNPSYSNTVV